MFEYKTRTKLNNGCEFVNQDILLYDYLYSGDLKINCSVEYNTPGFGFVILENSENNVINENVYLFKLGTDNRYQIISKQLDEQTLIKNEFVEAGSSFKINETMNLEFVFTEDSKIELYKISKNKKAKLFTYNIPHQIKAYKIGYYSSASNIIKFADISTESPSNWISNIENGEGGRIHWIKNGFIIEDCTYDCEVESQINPLKAGTYFLDFKSTNPNIKYYIFPSERKDTDIKREMSDILKSKEDEKKNILDYKDNSFTLEEDKNINIKFKGKYGTISNICIKKYKDDSFVETDYETTKREASYIKFDLNKIKKIELAGTINSVAEKRHSVFVRGVKSYTITDMNIELNKSYDYIYEDNKIKIGADSFDIKDDSNELIAFKNLNGIITKLLVTYNNGDVVDVLLQKTLKITVDKEIKTPIIVTDLNYNPFNLSSTYRKVIQESKHIDLFNKFKPIELTHQMILNHSDIVVFGINSGIINTEAIEIDDFASNYELISYNHYKTDYKHNKILLKKEYKERYKYIGVQYKHSENYLYEFTNWDREIFNIEEERNLYIKYPICNVVGSTIVYGIPKEAEFFSDRLMDISNFNNINSIDYCTNLYDILLDNSYTITSTNKLYINEDIKEKYKYIIVDYLRDDNYVVNERDSYYEVDIATTKEEIRTIYDYTEERINTYSNLKLTNISPNNFIVLRKEE